MPEIPRRQKFFFSIVLIAGLGIFIVYSLGILSIETIRPIVLFYGFSIPLIILASDLVIDLKDKKVFTLWMLLGIVFVIIFMLLRNSPNLAIRDKDVGDPAIRDWVSNNATSGLRSLPAFLIIYKLLSIFLQKTSGRYIVNTFRLSRWYNDAAGRRVDWLDVLINLVLFVTIILAAALNLNRSFSKNNNNQTHRN